MEPALAELVDRVRAAASAGTPLRIRAGGTKDFYGNEPRGTLLDPRGHAGVVAYEPSELVVTARAGTTLEELDAVLAANDQMLPFEPPSFGSTATLGGCIAAGLAGPRRSSYGSAWGGVRDFVLGARLLDGRGELLTFGGTVIKNVAGYDVARVLAGSLGILGLIVEVSVKVLPRPPLETTLALEADERAALRALNEWGRAALPISASAWHARRLWLRLSGSAPAVHAARAALGGEELDREAGERFWRDVREQTAEFFAGSVALWRLSLPSTAKPLEDAEQLIEWGGAQRWVRSRDPGEEMRARAQGLGGHATLFRHGDRARGVFTPLPRAAAAIHRRLKAAFDPARIFNPGRMYEEL